MGRNEKGDSELKKSKLNPKNIRGNYAYRQPVEQVLSIRRLKELGYGGCLKKNEPTFLLGKWYPTHFDYKDCWHFESFGPVEVVVVMTKFYDIRIDKVLIHMNEFGQWCRDQPPERKSITKSLW